MKIFYQPLKRQPHKLVKHTQTIRQQQPSKMFSCGSEIAGVDLFTTKICSVYQG